MAKRKKTAQDFDWEHYGNTVLANIDQLRDDVERLKDQVDEVNKNSSQIGAMATSQAFIKDDMARMLKKIEDLATEFQGCRLRSVKEGGVSNTELAVLKKDMERFSQRRSIVVSVISSIVAGTIVLIVGHFINNHK